MNTSPYSHTQRNRRLWRIVGALTVLDLAVIGCLVQMSRNPWPLLIAPVLCLVIAFLSGLMMQAFTIEIRDGELRWAFGPGWFRHRERLADVTDAFIVKTGWLDGWGIHFTRFGWLYNIAGNTAVMVRLRDGRALALGTDDAPTLLAALKPDSAGQTKAPLS